MHRDCASTEERLPTPAEGNKLLPRLVILELSLRLASQRRLVWAAAVFTKAEDFVSLFAPKIRSLSSPLCVWEADMYGLLQLHSLALCLPHACPMEDISRRCQGRWRGREVRVLFPLWFQQCLQKATCSNYLTAFLVLAFSKLYYVHLSSCLFSSNGFLLLLVSGCLTGFISSHNRPLF